MFKNDVKYNTRTVLMGLWVVLVFMYLYCDIFSFFRTGTITDILEGKMGIIDVTQMSLVIASVMLMLPILMILVNLLLKSKMARMLNIIMGILFIFVNIGNLAQETWVYYWIYGIIELIITIFIVITAIKWGKEVKQ